MAQQRDDLEAERGTLKEALAGLQARTGIVKRSRKPHFIRTLVIADGAYMLGTRDGRERYDQIVKKARSLSESLQEPPAGT